ncbi:39194_t:CDS:2, partial [Gigaspora margarita]
QVNRITNYTINLSLFSLKQQKELTKVVVEFIINDVQPLYILQNLSFRQMLLEFQPQYQIPCANNCIASVFQQPCAAHILQLSVKKELKQIKSVHQRLKSIQVFFRLPKQAQRLREAQMYINSANLPQETNENKIVNPLEILTDFKTCWNFAYLVWKRILELHPVMHILAVLLQVNSDTILKKETDVIDLLKSFEEMTRLFCGTKYSTVNLIYPYIRMLKNKYALVAKNGKSIEDWITLIYGSLSENSETSDYASTSSGDEVNIPLVGNRKQWQYTHCQGQGSRHSSKHKRYSKSSAELAEDDNFNTVKYFPPISCEGLLEKMRVTIYLSLDELWSVPNENNNITEVFTNEKESDSLSAELWNSFSTPISYATTEDKLTKYLNEQIANRNQNPLL